jgi:hypothetical protein
MSFQDKRITELDELTSPVSGDYFPVVDVSDTAAGTTKKITYGNIVSNISLSATNITSGTLADARLSANVTLQGNSFNAASKLVQLDGSAKLPAVDGSQLTLLNASNLASGTLPDARLSANVSIKTKVVNAIGVGGAYALTDAFKDTWYVTAHPGGTVTFVLADSPALQPGTEFKIFTNSAQAVSFNTGPSTTAMYVGGSIAPGGTYTPLAAAGRTITVSCVGTNLVFISGI